ncbi:MAG: hypothetical protein IJX00_00375 [Clostridia bacterium]|nr:hypothetical protein [Clostridia bacterium]
MAEKTGLAKKILSGVLVLCAALAFIFMAFPVIDLKVMTFSVYDMIKGGGDALWATILVFLIIFSSVLALAAILKLLAVFGVIKNAKFEKIINIVLLVASIGLTVVAVAHIIKVCVVYKADLSLVGWAGLILTALTGAGSIVATVFATKK